MNGLHFLKKLSCFRSLNEQKIRQRVHCANFYVYVNGFIAQNKRLHIIYSICIIIERHFNNSDLLIY